MLALASTSAAVITTELIWAIIGTILLAVAFYFIGVRVDRAVRWRHLIYLAVGTTILTILVNAVFLRTAPTAFSLLGSAFQAFLAMGIGGAFAARAKGRTQPQVPAAQVAQPMVPQMPYGYGYGAPVPGSTPVYPQPVPGYGQPAPGSVPLYPQPHAGWNPSPSPAAPSVYPSAWPYPPAQSTGQPPGSMPPTSRPQPQLATTRRGRQ